MVRCLVSDAIDAPNAGSEKWGFGREVNFDARQFSA